RRFRAFDVCCRTVLPRRNVEQAGLRTVRWRIPVCTALIAGINESAFLCWYDSRRRYRPAFGVKPCCPIRLYERLPFHELAGNAIYDVEIPVAVRPEHDLTGPALPIDLGEHGSLRGIPVELVMRRKLVVPLEFAVIGIECDDGAAVKIVAESRGAVPVRAWISRAPVGEIQIGIVRTRHPDRGAAVHPGIAAPGFVSRFAGTWNGVESPDFLTRIHVPRCDESTHAVFASGCAGDDFIFHDEWRVREGIALLGIGGLCVPDFLAGLGIDRNHARIQRGQEQLVTKNRQPAREPAAA